MSSVVSYELIDTIGVITVNNPPVNALSQALRQGLLEVITAAQKDASEALVLMCAGRTFIAGADITEFGKPPVAPFLPDVLAALENSRKLIVAAIHGTALGGGFETALACHYRCAVPSAKVGLPEVKLGLLPGAGGTQRVPRLAGVKAALEIITSGNPLGAAEAADLNLLDEVLPDENLREGAIAYARDLVDSGALLKRVRDITINPSSLEPGFFDTYRRKLAQRCARADCARPHRECRGSGGDHADGPWPAARTRPVHGIAELLRVPCHAAHFLRRAGGCKDQGPAGEYPGA
jgi:3-hydroxyacyl-CoA dehydrogenase